MGEIGAAGRAVRAERRALGRGLRAPDPGARRIIGPRTVMASPPTVTLGDVNASGTISGKNFQETDTTVFRYFGATPVQDSLWYVKDPTTQYWAVDFEIDCDAFEFYAKSGATAGKYRLIVDGEYATADPQAGQTGGGGGYFVLVEFASQANRHVVIEMDSIMEFGGVYVETSDHVWKSSTPVGPRVIVLGDSYTEGSGANGIQSWAVEMANALGWRDIQPSGSGGTGYLNPGTGGRVKFRDRVQDDVLDRSPDIVIVAGGINDAGSYTASAIETEAALLFDAIATGAPTATLIALSNWRQNGSPDSTVLAVRDAIESAATGRVDLFIDSIVAESAGANTLGWITGTGKSGSAANNGNADRYISSDGTHPTQAGHAYLGRRVASAIVEALPL